MSDGRITPAVEDFSTIRARMVAIRTEEGRPPELTGAKDGAPAERPPATDNQNSYPREWPSAIGDGVCYVG